jgi:hypothetical protein
LHWRWALRPLPETQGLAGVLAGLLAAGLSKWLVGLPAFLFVQEGRLASLIVWIVLFASLAAGTAWASIRQRSAPREAFRLAALGIALMLLVAAAQSPTLANAPLFFFSREGFNPGAVVSARFYYLPLVGFALVVAALAEWIVRANDSSGIGRAEGGAAEGRIPRPLAALAMLAVCTLIGFAATSRAIARQWALFTHDRAGVHAAPAIEAISALRNLAPGCKIYLLDTPPAADLFRDMADTGVKKSLPHGHPALGCFIQAEHAPWYHLLERSGLPPDAERPFEIIEAGGRPYPPLDVGNLVYYFVRVRPGDTEALDDPHAIFLAWREGRYVDVTAEVRGRKRVPKLYDRRAP